jgi:superfamily II DNA/RNA helicase
MAVFDDLLEDPQAKAVVFSQWIGMHDMIARRLDQRKIGYVMFNGSVPAEKRKALIEQFRNDSTCRVFLSTDAGGVGLNLQHAATVVNMDLPWNPAVMEQRIARVHRMGQQRSVQVVNFVAQGTIEESMLSLLGFKRALFAGVLDGGNAEVSLGGSRLSRFMEGVEKVAGNTGAPQMQETPSAAESETVATQSDALRDALSDAPSDAPDAQHGDEAVAEPANVAAGDALSQLINAGLNLLTEITAPKADGKTASSLLELDEQTGRSYLRLPVPDPAVLTKLTALTAALAGLFAPHAGK